MRRIATVLSVLTLLLVGLLTFKLRAQDAQLRGPAGGSGEIEGTEVRLASKISARILELKVKEGEAVKPGDLLVRLDCSEPEQALAEAMGRLASAQAQSKGAQAQAQSALGQQQAAAASVSAARAQAEALAAQRDASRRQAERLEAVGNDVAFSNRDQVRASAQGLEHQVQAAKASSEASAGQATAASGQVRAAQAQVENAESAIRIAEAALARAKLLVAECEVRAPREAVVEELPFEVGELVAPGSVLVELIDLREVTATFYLPNAEIAVVRPGAQAQVAVDAFPDEVFQGVVRTVSLKAEFTPRNIQTRTDRDRLVYPVEVAIANPDLKLRAGMPVQVTLPGTSR
ncbi:MAG: HlyD family efflux transporter periplasmic adaptor subunit [Deltaproteobacteria bacterium]|nr:HlyD family efflux transporter periplasmic adaptor subunit [Deltaproteobacteria bacterium]